MKIMIHAKQRLVIVRALHIEYDFSLKSFLFSLSLAPPSIIKHPETVNCCNFVSVPTFVGDFGQELSSCKHAARL